MFLGFHENTLKFFFELGLNNTKSWFEAHRGDYEEFVMKPMREFVVELSGFMKDLDPQIEIPANPNKSIARIYRDVRFSKDKSPYRTNLWVSFKRPTKDWKLDPGYFFEIFADRFWYGMGFFVITPEIRERMTNYALAQRDEFKSVMDCIANSKFTVGGDRYKRPIRKDIPDDVREFCERKSIYLYYESPITDSVFDRGITEEMKRDFESILPVYNYLWAAK